MSIFGFPFQHAHPRPQSANPIALERVLHLPPMCTTVRLDHNTKGHLLFPKRCSFFQIHFIQFYSPHQLLLVLFSFCSLTNIISFSFPDSYWGLLQNSKYIYTRNFFQGNNIIIPVTYMYTYIYTRNFFKTIT